MLAIPEAEFSQRVLIKTILGRPDGGAALAGQTVRIGGWVRTGRVQGKGAFAFLELNDGSCMANLQVIVHKDHKDVSSDLGKLVRTGTCVHVQGELKSPPVGAKQKIELRSVTVLHIGAVDRGPSKYPLPKTRMSLEFLRQHMHLRPRTNTISAITRVRNALAFATHTFFQKHGFLYVHTPIITTSDCEGAGEMFQVTTLLKDNEEDDEKKKIDYSRDFFGRQAYLTVSGQLEVETFACGLSNVYTFGPTFRAEHSHTSRHLAEFWMVEPEIAFADLEDDMRCAEAYVKFLCQWLLDNCLDEMEFMVDNFDKSAIDRLRMVASCDFVRISYTEALDILEEVQERKQFENKVEWGVDLASEHERYLTEEKFERPVIVYNYPKEIKPFYMKLNDDELTVAAMDVLVPKVGELIGGSQREDDYNVIVRRMEELGLPLEPYKWYLDLRSYGTVKHSGFGLGFERMILFATGMDNIRDVIPFPRYPGRADFK